MLFGGREGGSAGSDQCDSCFAASLAFRNLPQDLHMPVAQE